MESCEVSGRGLMIETHVSHCDEGVLGFGVVIFDFNQIDFLILVTAVLLS